MSGVDPRVVGAGKMNLTQTLRSGDIGVRLFALTTALTTAVSVATDNALRSAGP